jgi:hemolysin III
MDHPIPKNSPGPAKNRFHWRARGFTRTSRRVDSPVSPNRSICIVTGERFNAWTHFSGLVLAILGIPLMLAKTLPGGDAGKIAGGLVFALSSVVLYAASTFFHSSHGRTKLRWQRVDHCAIYLLIAGSYTPFALVTLQGPWGWALLVTVWGMALLGIGRELLWSAAKPPLALYIGMGWLGVVAAAPLVARLEAGGLLWLLAGAALYTVGTIFYVNRAGYRHAHGVWHLFVLGGTASHYVAIAGFVV